MPQILVYNEGGEILISLNLIVFGDNLLYMEPKSCNSQFYDHTFCYILGLHICSSTEFLRLPFPEFFREGRLQKSCFP